LIKDDPHNDPAKKSIYDVILQALLLLVVILFIIPLLFVFGIKNLLARIKFLSFIREQKKQIIFVYSNSPHWKTYIEENYFPLLTGRAFTLNWSERATWDEKEWPVKAVKYWGGDREFNPMAIVYINFFKIKVIRFFSAFNDYKFGRTTQLKKAEDEFFNAIRKIQ
jgi:hypothetical protein